MYYGSGERTQDFTSASDIGNAICCAVSNVDANGVFNIASGKPISMCDLAKLVIRAIAGTKSRAVPSGQPDPQEDYRAAFDISKAQRLLGWRPIVSLEEGIRQWAQCLKRCAR
jgi:UDP-glucose 4-epimerase